VRIARINGQVDITADYQTFATLPEGVLASVEIRVATPQNVETLWPSDISTRRRNHPCGRYDGFGDKGKTWS